MKVRTEPLTADAFAGYGEIIETPKHDYRISISERIVNLREVATASVKLISRSPSILPLIYPVMERHLHSSQAFVPVNGARCIVVVAPKLESGDPDIANCRAFRSNAGQGFIYGPNVWHCPLRVLDKEGKFVVVMYIAGLDDEEFLTLPHKIIIS